MKTGTNTRHAAICESEVVEGDWWIVEEGREDVGPFDSRETATKWAYENIEGWEGRYAGL